MSESAAGQLATFTARKGSCCAGRALAKPTLSNSVSRMMQIGATVLVCKRTFAERRRFNVARPPSRPRGATLPCSREQPPRPSLARSGRRRPARGLRGGAYGRQLVRGRRSLGRRATAAAAAPPIRHRGADSSLLARELRRLLMAPRRARELCGGLSRLHQSGPVPPRPCPVAG